VEATQHRRRREGIGGEIVSGIARDEVGGGKDFDRELLLFMRHSEKIEPLRSTSRRDRMVANLDDCGGSVNPLCL
jgi:hypothetical protein